MQLAITNLSSTDPLELPYLEKVVKAGATIVLSVAQSELSKMVDLQQAVADGLAEYQVEPTAVETASGILVAGLPTSSSSGGDTVEARPINGVSDDWPTLFGVIIPAAKLLGKSVTLLPGKNGERWQAKTPQLMPSSIKLIGTPQTVIQQTLPDVYASGAFTTGEQYIAPYALMTADTAPGSDIISVTSVAKIHVGDWVIINEHYVAQPQWSVTAKVLAVNGLAVTLDRKVRQQLYGPTGGGSGFPGGFDGEKVLTLDPATYLHDFVLEGNGMQLSGTGYCYVLTMYCRDVKITGLNIIPDYGVLAADGIAMYLSECRDLLAKDMKILPGQVCTEGFHIDRTEDAILDNLLCEGSGVGKGFNFLQNIGAVPSRIRAFNTVVGINISGNAPMTLEKACAIGCTAAVAIDHSSQQVLRDLDVSWSPTGVTIDVNSTNCELDNFVSHTGLFAGPAIVPSAPGFILKHADIVTAWDDGIHFVKSSSYEDYCYTGVSAIGQFFASNITIDFIRLTVNTTGTLVQGSGRTGCRVVIRNSPTVVASAGITATSDYVLELENSSLTVPTGLWVSTHTLSVRLRGTVVITGLDVAAGYAGTVYYSRGTITANGAGTAQDVLFPDTNASDHLRLTRVTTGGVPSTNPLIVRTISSKFAVTFAAGDTSNYEFDIG